MSKAKLVAELNSEHRAILELVQGFGRADFDQPGANGDWTAKDVFGHLAFWNGEAARAIMMALQGERPTAWLDAAVDSVNQHETETRRARPLHKVMEEFRRSHRELVALLERTPENRLEVASDHKAPDGASANAAWIGSDAAGHYRLHREALQTWLSRS